MNRIAKRALGAVVVLFLAGAACTGERPIMEGAFSLERYRMGGEEQDSLSGLMLLADGRAIVIYTMRDGQGGWAGRAHAGPYELEGDTLTLDIELWPEVMGGVANAAPAVRDVIRVAAEGDALELHFASGSMQRWSRISENGEAPGSWLVRGAVSGGETREAEGYLLGEAGHFAFVYRTQAMNGDSPVRAYGGTSRVDDNGFLLRPKWMVDVKGDEGLIANGGPVLTLERLASDHARVTGPDGIAYELWR